MKILSIETSADETAVSLVEVTGDFPHATYDLLGNGLRSQIELHNQYGGIFPAMAKREHAKALVPLLEHALTEAEALTAGSHELTDTHLDHINSTLEREPALTEALITFLQKYDAPEIDLIAVTTGPGLAPALWVGVNFAKALSKLWNVHVVPVNHMEGHILASLYDVVEDDQLAAVQFPALSLLISGGHTELVLMKDWKSYEKIGQTRDDAVGEAFDKVARLMGLSYPGGPAIGKLAAEARKQDLPPYKADLPKPMLQSGDLDFSFSGLKTAVRYAIQDQELTEEEKQRLSRDFEDTVGDVLLQKTSRAMMEHNAKTLIVGGGVSASPYLRQIFNTYFLKEFPDAEIYFPKPGLSTDNAIMIALAGHARADSASNPAATQLFQADGNKSL